MHCTKKIAGPVGDDVCFVVRVVQLALKGRSMQNHDLPTNKPRAEYHRKDLAKLVRGKFASRGEATACRKDIIVGQGCGLSGWS